MIHENKITKLTEKAHSIQTAIKQGSPYYGRKTDGTTQEESNFVIPYHTKGSPSPWHQFLQTAIEMMWEDITQQAQHLAEEELQSTKGIITEQVVALMKEL